MATQNTKYTLYIIAIVPGPVNGMTLTTRLFIDQAVQKGPVRLFPIAHPVYKTGPVWLLYKGFRHLAGIFFLLGHAFRRRKRLYMVANSRHGLWYNVLLAAGGRLMGYQMALHHQVYAYIDKRDIRMALLDRLLGDRGMHIVHSRSMGEKIKQKYRSRAVFHVLANPVPGNAAAAARPHAPFCIGSMSNLTLKKGLKVILQTFERLENTPVRLVLAGPCADKPARQAIRHMGANWPRRFEYRGPVYGDQKWTFFQDIDVFLFPTLYANESWPLVINEALASGVPVIAYGRGCIPDQLTEKSGIVVPPGGDYPAVAGERIRTWLYDSRNYTLMAHNAEKRGEAIRRDSAASMKALIDRLFNEQFEEKK